MFGHRERGIYQQQVLVSSRHDQQDAEEFYAYLLNAMASTLHTSHHGEPSDLVRDLFQIRFQCTCVLWRAVTRRYSCAVSGECYTTEEDALKLYCNIRGGDDENRVNFMYQVESVMGGDAQGIKLGLESDVEKHSDVLGRSAQWRKTMRISSVPKYLCVQVGVREADEG